MEAEGSLVGRTLGTRFRIEKCIGRGGMATVYSAHVESGERAGTDVALKVVNRELTRDPMVLRRFHREAKSASRLKHPNTVEVYEYGVDGADAFIAMELAQGQDLLQALAAENPMRQARAALIVAQICAGLSAAHAQGIIHRDLKPENVMLIPDPDEAGGERVKVLDFGIAKIVDTPKPGSGGSEDEQPSYVTKTALTRVGTIVGTPAYMSPEQCRGGELDGRSDVYSCGVLLYQILTGEVPFTGETPLHTAMRHIHAQPKPPRELRASLAPNLEKVVLKALAKWPGERHQTADQLREELLGLVTSLPDAQGIDTSKLGGKANVVPPGVVIPGKAKPESVMDATELVIQTDPRMENGALGAGKLGSVRLSSLAAMQSKPSAAAPAAEPPAAAPAGAPGARAAFTKTEAGQSGAPPADEQKTGERRPAQTKPAERPRAPTPQIAPGKTPVQPDSRAARPGEGGAPSWARGAPNAVPTAESAEQVNRRNTLRGGYVPSKAGDPRAEGEGPETTPRSDGGDEPRTLQTHARDVEEAVTGQAQAPAPGAVAVSTQPLAQQPPSPHAPANRTLASAGTSDGRRQSAPGAPRPRRATETGLTPTAQIARDRVAAAEQAALASAPLETPDDDDEPQTFIRTPPASPGEAQQAGPYSEPSYSDDEKRTQHNTLVMDESQARQVSPAAHLARSPARTQDAPHASPQRSPALPRTLDAQVDPNARAMIDAAYDENVGRAPQMSDPSLGVHRQDPSAMMQPHPGAFGAPGGMNANAMAPTQLPLSSSQIIPGHPSHGMPPSRPAPEEFADISSVGSLPRPDGFGQIKVDDPNVAEAVQRSNAMYPVGLRRTQSGPAGLRGKLEEFSGAALLLIGIAVGLFLALIGLVIVILMK